MREALDGEAFDRLMQDFANGGRWDLVLRFSRDRLASVPGCPDAHRWAAWGALETGELEVAAWHVAHLEALAPDDASTFRVMAELYSAHSRWDEARECVEQAIVRWPENAHYYLMLSRIHEYQDDRPAAVAAAEQALRLDPQDIAARFAVNLYKYDGIQKVHQIEGQIAELLSIVSDDPHNATILAEIGELYLLRLNQPAAAFPFLEQALSNCPSDERIERLYHLARYRLEASVEHSTSRFRMPRLPLPRQVP